VRERLLGGLLSAAVLAAILYPVAWKPPRDSFPLSNYPMFARRQTSPEMSLQYAIGVEADGTRRPLRPALVANEEVLQARAVIADAFRRGPVALDALCRRIAGRVAARGREVAGVVEVRLMDGRHDAIAFLVRGELGREEVRRRCPVEQGR
jgi:hypothetical protein